jgi:hypothetical protein
MSQSATLASLRPDEPLNGFQIGADSRNGVSRFNTPDTPLLVPMGPPL